MTSSFCRSPGAERSLGEKWEKPQTRLVERIDNVCGFSVLKNKKTTGASATVAEEDFSSGAFLAGG